MVGQVIPAIDKPAKPARLAQWLAQIRSRVRSMAPAQDRTAQIVRVRPTTLATERVWDPRLFPTQGGFRRFPASSPVRRSERASANYRACTKNRCPGCFLSRSWQVVASSQYRVWGSWAFPWLLPAPKEFFGHRAGVGPSALSYPRRFPERDSPRPLQSGPV